MAAPFDRSLVPPALLALDAERIAEEFGTPVFVYDEDEVRRRCREFAAAFDAVAYASKAFLCVAMARLVAEEGLHLDVATGGELHVALAAGFPAERIVLHGNNKSEYELATALDVGVGRIVLDSFDEIDRLDELADARGLRPAVLVRVTPGIEAHTHEYIETGTERSKFGFTVSEGVAHDAVRRVARSDRLELVGLHCHIGSQIFVLESYARAIDVVVGLAAETGVPIEELNVGGGLGARYLVDAPVLDVDEYAEVVRTAVTAACADHGIREPKVMVEPGRAITAAAAMTLYRVGTVKEIPGVGTYVAVDGGMSDNPRPVLYGAGYEAFLPLRVDEPCGLRAAVVGKHCEQGDVVVADARLPAPIRPGELLATPCTGAYGVSMASNYNKVPRPAVVFVRDGNPRVVVRRETLDDLLRLDES